MRFNSSTVKELIANVQKAFKEYPHKILNFTFLSLQACMNKMLRCNGGNTYKVPHLNKEKKERLGILPLVLTCFPHDERGKTQFPLPYIQEAPSNVIDMTKGDSETEDDDDDLTINDDDN
jgi:hypothetical protein